MTRRDLLRVAFRWVGIFSVFGIVICGGARHVQAQSSWTQDAYKYVPEAVGMQIDYALQIPNTPIYDNYANGYAAPAYGVNNSASITPGSFSRIGYFLELQTSSGSLQYMYVSFDAAPFSTDPTKLGVPTSPGGVVGDGTTFHYGVGSIGGGGQIANMNVYTNVAGITTGTGIQTGNAQFWGTNYNATNVFNVPNGSGTNYDDGDNPQNGNYGLMSIYNYASDQTLFSFNEWGGQGTCGLGIGNDPSPVNGGVNWTFASNAASFTVKNIIVLVGNPNTWTGAGTSAWSTSGNWQAGVVPVAGTGITLGAVAGGVSAATIDLGGNQAVNALTFQNVVPSVTVTSTGGFTLSLSNGTNSVPVSVSGNHFINSAVALPSTAAITVVSGSDSLTFNSAISGTGGVTLAGLGTLNLTASNSYTGGTVINGGRLNLTGSGSLANISTAGVTINSGGILATAAATPTIYSIALGSGGTLLPGGNASTGLLSVGSLTMAGSSTLGFKAASAANYDQINVGTALTIGGSNISLNLYSPNGAGQFYGNGTFTLLSNAGSLTGTPSSAIAVANPLSDMTYTIGTAGNSVTLTVATTGANPVWNGGSSVNWSDAGNWTNGAPISSNVLRFDGSANLATTNNQSSPTYAGMLFYTSAGAFTHSGNGVALTGPITNYSPNTQTLNLPVQMLLGGTVNAVGGPIVTTALGTLDNGGGTLMLGGISSSTYNGAITGAGGVTVFGPGSVTLASSLNTYAGNTRIQSGTLTVGGAPSGSLALQNTVVDMNVADAGMLSFGGQSTVTLGGLIGARNISLGSTNLSIGALGTSFTSSSPYTGVLSGAGSLTKIGNGNVSLGGANAYTGGTYVTAGTLTLGGLSTIAKIMCVGDSITEGIANSTIGYGYRGALYNDLIAAGYSNVEMVGTHNTGTGNAPYTLPPIAQYHDGWGGWTTGQIQSNMSAWLTALATGNGNGGNGTTNNTGNLLPDYITMMIGTNNVGANPVGSIADDTWPAGTQPATPIGQVAYTLDIIHAQDPHAETLLAEITPRNHSTTSSDWEYTYNQAIIALVAAEQAKGYNVVLANMNGYGTNNPFPYAAGTNSNYPLAGMGGDNLHPNDYGYSWMAQQWFNQLTGAAAPGPAMCCPPPPPSPCPATVTSMP